MKVGKYEFKSKEQALSKIEGLPHKADVDGIKHPTYKHIITHLGSVIKEDAEFENGVMIKDPVYGVYRLDVLWIDIEENPYGWKTYEIDLDNEGLHTFGLSYLENKI
jgi:hypothetical protein